MVNPLIRIGGRMKKWFREIVNEDFGDVSDAKGLYNILCLYEKYVPEGAKIKYKNGKRLLRKRWI